MPTFTAAQLARELDGEVIGDSTVTLTGFAPADRARAGDLVFAENEKYLVQAEQSGASAILAAAAPAETKKTIILVTNPRVAFARVLPLFFPEAAPKPGIHASAVIAPSAQVDPAAHVGPHCVVGERVRIGPRTALLGGNHIGDDSQIGEDSRLFPNVVIYPRTQLGSRVRIHAGAVIGSDGYGYVFDQGQHRKVLQLGNVIVGDDVEIGANTTVDRGALGPTIIGRGTKIDNLVQIAHNVVMGEGCLIVAQVGLAGSVKFGDHVIIGGQAAVAGHLKIGSRVTIAGRSGVMHDIPDGEKWMGLPACPDREAKRQWIALKKLPDLFHRVAELEKKLGSNPP